MGLIRCRNIGGVIKILDFFANILSYIIEPIYRWTQNYGVAVILFTIIVKILMFPLGIKQQKTTSKTKLIQPELKKIQDKYKNDKEKLNQEMMKLYEKHGVNPMGGCLPLLLQFPIMFGLYRVIQRPITFILRSNPLEELEKIGSRGLDIITELAQKANVDITGLSTTAEIYNAVGNRVSEIDIASSIGNLVQFNFLGLDLSKTPSITEPSFLWLIPIAATAMAFLSNFVTRKLNGMPSGEQEQMNKSMSLMMPLMTLFFTFTFQAGIGVYWFMSSALSILQMIILSKYYDKKFAADAVAVSDKGGKKKGV